MPTQIRSRTPASTGKIVPLAAAVAPKRFQLDYASWHARIAAPGSRIEPASTIPMRIARRTSVAQTADRNRTERRRA